MPRQGGFRLTAEGRTEGDGVLPHAVGGLVVAGEHDRRRRAAREVRDQFRAYAVPCPQTLAFHGEPRAGQWVEQLCGRQHAIDQPCRSADERIVRFRLRRVDRRGLAGDPFAQLRQTLCDRSCQSFGRMVDS